MNFSEALQAVKGGSRMSRTGWNGAGMWLELWHPFANSVMTRPYLYLKAADGGLVPWVASQSDLLADDWIEV